MKIALTDFLFIGLSRNNASPTRRIVRRINTNFSSSRNSLNSFNGNYRPKVIGGQGGRRVNTNFDGLNRRKSAGSRNYVGGGFSFSRNTRGVGGNRKGMGHTRFYSLTGKSGPDGKHNGDGSRGRGNSGGFRRRGNRTWRSRGGRRPQKNNNSISSLDAALDSYMGVDACKARLDSQLDSYFSGHGNGNNDGMLAGDSAMNMETNQEPVMISL
ncbi:Chromatin target of PRMT1 protein-like protein [Cryptosporidium felis]|nr:Chromatin target of PRMT1 protein-like protein [Cryptosporidium felis]